MTFAVRLVKKQQLNGFAVGLDRNFLVNNVQNIWKLYNF